MRVHSPILPLLAALALSTGCASKKSAREQEAAKYERQALSVKVQEVTDNYHLAVEVASQTIRSGSQDSDVKRWAVRWQAATHNASRRARLLDNGVIALLDLWSMSLQRAAYFSEGEGSKIFGAGQPTAIETETNMALFIEQICERLLPADAFAVAKEETHAFVESHPIKGGLRTWHTGEQSPRGESIFGKVISVFPSLGIQQTAGSISEVASAVDGVGTVVGDVPTLARWNAELMMYDLNENETVVDLRRSIHTVSASVEKAVDVAEELPAELQNQVSKTLDEIEAKQPQLQKTLQETGSIVDNAKQTVTEVRGALKDANSTVETVDKIAANFAEAGKVWKPTVTEFRALYRELEGPVDPNPPPRDPDAPNDLENLARTAEGLTSAAIELRGTVAEVRGILESEAPDKINATAVATVDHTTEKVAGIVSGLIWQLLLLAFGIAVIVLAYRFTASRVLKAS